jgi:molybdenum cofactor cytidylyltransferase
MSKRLLTLAAIVLAGGHSRRTAPVNKLLALWKGRPLVAYAVEAALGSKASPVVLVTGHQAELVAEALAEHTGRLMFVHNPDHVAGLSTTLKAGLDALPDDVDGALVLLGDMPGLTASHINRLIDGFDGKSIIVPVCRGRRGNPVLWPRRYLRPLREELSGDRGGRDFLKRRGRAVVKIEMDEAVLADVDTREELERP